MAPLFTIGIPVYNAMPYLRETIESVLAQSDRDFEILAIDDGSKDDSWEYLQSLSDPRLRVISQENRKLTGTLNRMLEEVSTPWLMRLDADDVALPDRVACMRKHIELHPDAGMFYTRARYLNHSNATSNVRTTEGTPAELRAQTELGYLLPICHCTVVLNVRKALSLGGYRFNLHVEDLDLWWRMALAHDIVFVPETTVAVRLNNGSVCINNLEDLAYNTLYVQHLLLAHLWHRPILPYEMVRANLNTTIRRGDLRYRELMWKAAIDLGDQKYGSAAKLMMAAAINAPRRFVTRCVSPLSRNSQVRVGENPQVLQRALGSVWAEAAENISGPGYPQAHATARNGLEQPGTKNAAMCISHE
jgi:glycosyltransferase involved in cell wall biosynthesis